VGGIGVDGSAESGLSSGVLCAGLLVARCSRAEAGDVALDCVDEAALVLACVVGGAGVVLAGVAGVEV
jgi:hypothetical protein